MAKAVFSEVGGDRDHGNVDTDAFIDDTNQDRALNVKDDDPGFPVNDGNGVWPTDEDWDDARLAAVQAKHNAKAVPSVSNKLPPAGRPLPQKVKQARL